VTVTYGGLVVLGQLDWIFRAGENWALTGPNGAGKSTLIRLITGEIEQAYSNEIYVFGKKRGTGESIWDIKRRIGVLGTELQLLYRKGISAFDVVVSGFYDSIGLYRRPDSEKRHNAEKIMERMKLTHLAGRIFDSLSFGEQRLVLMARAVVKSPRLLILDEPCQGLDARNRSRVIELADSIGASGDIQLLFVTHYRNEIPASVNRELRIRKPVGGITPSTFFCR
jgi:molybdate transport system ATP-binding protein